MDKTFWFPVFSGIKSDFVKVVCNCDGFDKLKGLGFVKSADELPAELPKPKKEKPAKEVE